MVTTNGLLLGNSLSGFLSPLLEWNLVLVILGACSILSMTIFIERLLYLRRAETNTNQFVLGIRRAITEQSIVDAIQMCETTGGTVANIVKSGLHKVNRGKEQIENAMEMSGLIEIANLERNARTLSIIAHIAPLIGLLGTVLGFIQAFAEMRLTGLMDISTTRIGEAMEYALVTTAAGLVVAIPTVIAYNYLTNRIEGLVLDMQTTATEVVDLLEDPTLHAV